MASGSIAGSTNNAYIACRLDWWSTPNYAGNYSDVYMELRAWRTNSGYTTSGTYKGSTYINGSGEYEERAVSLTQNSNTLIAVQSLRVYHGANGGAYIGLSADGGIPGTSWTATYVSGAVWLDTTKFSPYAPTIGSATRVSDTQHTVAWTNNPDAANGRPYESLSVQRWDNVGNVWSTVVSGLGGTTTSWSDTSTVADRSYKWRVVSVNGAGSATSGETAQLDTTPAAPSGCSAAKQTATSILVEWTNNATHDEAIEVWDNPGGTGYVKVYDGTASAVSWLHDPASSGVTHQYKVRAKSTTGGTLYSAYSNESAIVQLLTNPNAPSNLTGGVFDAAAAIVVGWQHNPQDSTAQTAYELQYRIVGAGSWTTTNKVTSAVSEKTFAAGLLVNGNTYEYQVRTWGQYATVPAYSPWSATQTFVTDTAPIATVQTPAEAGTLTSPNLTAAWTYFDAEDADQQSQYRVRLYDSTGATILKTHTGSGVAVRSQVVDYRLLNGVTYKLGVTVWDAAGIASAEDINTFSVDYLEPMQPLLVVTFDEPSGRASLAIENPLATGSEPPVTSNTVYRAIGDGEYELLLDNVPPNSTVTDWTPPLNVPVHYIVEAWSDLPSVKASEVEDATFVCHGKVFLNGGPAFGLVAVIGLEQGIGVDRKRTAAAEHFSGRTKPVLYEGEATSRTVKVSGLLADRAYRATLEAAMEATGAKVYRDPFGRRVVCAFLDGYSIVENQGLTYSFAATGVEVDDE